MKSIAIVLLLATTASAINFDGVDDGIERNPISYNADFPWTMVGWYKPRVNQIKFMGILGSNTNRPRGAPSQNSTLWRAYISDLFFGSTALTAGTWYHYALVRSSQANAALYIDGVQVATTAGGTAPPNQTARLRVGIIATTSWDGEIDDFRLYGRALSASEIEALYRGTRNLARKRVGGIGNRGRNVYWPMRDAQIGTNMTGTNTVRDTSGLGNHATGTGGPSLSISNPAVK